MAGSDTGGRPLTYRVQVPLQEAGVLLQDFLECVQAAGAEQIGLLRAERFKVPELGLERNHDLCLLMTEHLIVLLRQPLLQQRHSSLVGS